MPQAAQVESPPSTPRDSERMPASTATRERMLKKMTDNWVKKNGLQTLADFQRLATERGVCEVLMLVVNPSCAVIKKAVEEGNVVAHYADDRDSTYTFFFKTADDKILGWTAGRQQPQEAILAA